MGKRDKRVDHYIANAAPFAQPILNYLRELVHAGCPEVQETMKWSMPHFDYNGANLCGMAAFKKHCAFGFWKASLISDPDKILETKERTSMGSLGRIEDISDLPSDRIMIKYIKAAAKLNKEKALMQPRPKPAIKKLEVPAYFMRALSGSTTALKNFQNFSNSNKKEYVEWVTSAKTEATRERRLDTAIEWIEEGKVRHWKYVQK